MAAQLLAQAEQLGIVRYVIREAAVPVLERVLDLMGSPSRLPPPNIDLDPSVPGARGIRLGGDSQR
jgi:hypothetical protein